MTAEDIVKALVEIAEKNKGSNAEAAKGQLWDLAGRALKWAEERRPMGKGRT